jgi:acyl CoA:acetate/3-ketoacid CoA transferase alpha subunit
MKQGQLQQHAAAGARGLRPAVVRIVLGGAGIS